DAALQAVIGFGLARGDAASLGLPFELQRVEIRGRCAATMWAVARRSRAAADDRSSAGINRFDIDLCDESGRVCVRLTGLSTRRAAGREAMPAPPVIDEAPILDTSMDGLYRDVQATLTQTVSKLLLLPLEKVTADADLTELGFDSITLTEFAEQLN